MLSSKNTALSAASTDLGLGDQLKSQAEDEINKRKKRLQQMQMQAAGAMGPAMQSLMPGGSNGY